MNTGMFWETIQAPFVHRALIAGISVGGICAFLAVYVVLKRIVFVGAALAQVSAAGVAMGFLLGQSPLLFSILATLGAVVCFSLQHRERMIPRESLIGAAYGIAAAASVIFILKSPQGEDEARKLLEGDILTVTAGQIELMAAVFVVVALIHYLFAKEFLAVSFDPETASALGLKPRLFEMLFYLTLGVTISVAAQFAGTLLVFAFLVVPGVTALLVTRSMRSAFTVAVLSSIFATVLGILASALFDLPTGPSIVVLSAVFLMVAAMASPLIKGH
ncbi:MAG: metal ABC transporter permease [Armatimonadetes bacterium]|nr:metal ABC transporter permease [Armatimonadota bacterium]